MGQRREQSQQCLGRVAPWPWKRTEPVAQNIGLRKNWGYIHLTEEHEIKPEAAAPDQSRVLLSARDA